MNLQVEQIIDSGNVRLSFGKNAPKSSSLTDYDIGNAKADEYISQYNMRGNRLNRNINRAVAIFAVVGWGVSIWKKSLKMALLWVPLGILAGLGIGAAISAHRRNDLMYNYHVREYSVRSYF